MMPVMKDETGGVKKPQPVSPKKPTTPPIVKSAQPATPAPKQTGKPAQSSTPAQSGQVGTAKAQAQALPVPAAKLPLSKAAPVKLSKPQLASGKPTLKPVSLRYEQELMNNPMLKKIDRKMKEHPDLFGAVLRASDSPEKAFDKMFAMWGKDEEMDAKALKAFKINGNFRQQDNVDEAELRQMVDDVLKEWDEIVDDIDLTGGSVTEFRALSDLVASHTGDNLDDYLYIMNTLLLGYSTSGDLGMIATRGLTESGLPNVLPPGQSRIQIGTAGLNPDFDDEADPNQIGNHIWTYIATGASLAGDVLWNDMVGTFGNVTHEIVQEVVFDNVLRNDVSASWSDVLAGEVGLILGLRLRTGEITPSEFGEYFQNTFTQPYLSFLPTGDLPYDTFLPAELKFILESPVMTQAVGISLFGGQFVQAINEDGTVSTAALLEIIAPLRDH